MSRRWPRYALFGAIAIGVLIAVALAAIFATIFATGGLRPCVRLDDRLCRDLGAGDCELWKTDLGRVGSGSSQPHVWRGNRMVFVDIAIHKVLGWDAARSDNPLCSRQLGEQLYPRILSAIRDAVAGHRRRVTGTPNTGTK